MKQSKVFYGWYVVAVSFLCNFMATGTAFYLMNTFMQPLCEERGWTRTEVSMAIFIAGTIGFLSALIYGRLVYSVGPRILMTIGPLAAGVSFALTGMTENLLLFYLGYICLFISTGAMSGIVSGTVVNNWFIMKRGKALGLATTGVSLSGAILPYLALLILSVTSLRNAFILMGVLNLLVAPISWLLVRNRPEDHGLNPDGDISFQDSKASNENGLRLNRLASESSEELWVLPRLVRVQAFWKTGFAYMLILVGVVGIMSQLKPRFSDIGFDDHTAMLMMAATAFLGTLGKFFWGWLCDHFDSRGVVTLLMSMTALGMAFILGKNPVALFLFIFIFGFSMGGIIATLPILTADLFGRESFAMVLKYFIMFQILQNFGAVIMGICFDVTGSYNIAYILFIIQALIAAGLVFSIKRPGSEE